MREFEVPDMTCGHCAGVITRAISAAAPAAQVEIALASHRVRVQGGPADDDVLLDIIRQAGYTPKRV